MMLKNHLSPTDVPKVLYENRYCNKEGFSVLACGGIDRNHKLKDQVLQIKIPSFQVTEFSLMAKPHYRLLTTTINSEIFPIVDSTNVIEQLGSSCTSVEIYSEKSRTW